MWRLQQRDWSETRGCANRDWSETRGCANRDWSETRGCANRDWSETRGCANRDWSETRGCANRDWSETRGCANRDWSETRRCYYSSYWWTSAWGVSGLQREKKALSLVMMMLGYRRMQGTFKIWWMPWLRMHTAPGKTEFVHISRQMEDLGDQRINKVTQYGE